MKQKVIRQTLSGAFTAFTFDVKARAFFVKNFTDDDIFVSFENDGDENGSFKVKSGMGEEVYINRGTSNSKQFVNALYVKGTGEVEVEAIDF